MLEKDFAPYEPSLALKELGFDEPCFAFYNGKFIQSTEFDFDSYNSIDVGHHPLAPTFSQAFRWFREKYKLIGLVQRDITRNYNGWWFKILSQIEEKDNPILLYSEDFNKDTYEEAELACLTKLIEIVQGGNNE